MTITDDLRSLTAQIQLIQLSPSVRLIWEAVAIGPVIAHNAASANPSTCECSLSSPRNHGRHSIHLHTGVLY
ncbi:unnamed protein product [Gongylonema pulchrum]|uniref:Uncharacterized protein n=1 Tax=Gongylonema pulchrum TaxID=637853 RepID=A0A183DRY3_9BILA|nr:unnamed protein product [Gongylonema pulchrum]